MTTPPTTTTTPDLVLVPQLATRIPGDHLTPDQAERVWEDWTTTTHDPAPGQPVWVVATAHLDGNTLRITATQTIPRQ